MKPNHVLCIISLIIVFCVFAHGLITDKPSPEQLEETPPGIIVAAYFIVFVLAIISWIVLYKVLNFALVKKLPPESMVVSGVDLHLRIKRDLPKGVCLWRWQWSVDDSDRVVSYQKRTWTSNITLTTPTGAKLFCAIGVTCSGTPEKHLQYMEAAQQGLNERSAAGYAIDLVRRRLAPEEIPGVVSLATRVEDYLQGEFSFATLTMVELKPL